MTRTILLTISICGPIINYLIFVLSALLFTPGNIYSESAIKTLPITIFLGIVGIVVFFLKPHKIIILLLVLAISISSLWSVIFVVRESVVYTNKMNKVLENYVLKGKILNQEDVKDVLSKITNTNESKKYFKQLLDNKLIDPNTIIDGVNSKYAILYTVATQDKKYDIDYMKYLLYYGADPNISGMSLSMLNRILDSGGDLVANDSYERLKILINCGVNLDQVDFKEKTFFEILISRREDWKDKTKIDELIQYIKDINTGKIKKDCKV